MGDLECPRDDSSIYGFHSHIPELQAWEPSQKDRLQTRNPLRVPFALAIEMIRHKARDRPTFDKVVGVLADPAAAAANE